MERRQLYLLHFLCVYLFVIEIPSHPFYDATLDIKFGSVAQFTTRPINRELLIPAEECDAICRQWRWRRLSATPFFSSSFRRTTTQKYPGKKGVKRHTS